MQTIVSHLEAAFRSAITAAFGVDADPLLGASQNEKFADYQSNAAMGLARVVSEKTGQKTNPRAVAEQIKAKLAELGLLGDMAQEITIAGPGFINIRLSPAWLARQLGAIAPDPRLGIDKTPNPETVVVDYSGPNIAKEMHVGHLRSTIIGDAVSRVIEFRGDVVIRQNHIGDWGTQFGKVILAIWTLSGASRHNEKSSVLALGAELAALAKQAKKAKEDGNQDIQRQVSVKRAPLIAEAARRHQAYLKDDEDGTRFFEPFLRAYQPDLEELLPYYQLINEIEAAPEAKDLEIDGPYGRRSLAEQSKLITSFLQKGKGHSQEFEAWSKVRNATMEECQRIYERLGVKLTHSDERGESSYKDDLPNVVRELKEKGLAVESEGATGVFIDGPDKPPLIVEKSGGEGYLYGTTDLAAIRYRVRELHANRVIYFVDKRQAQHFGQVFATAEKAGWRGDTSLEYAPFGTVLGEDGKPLKTRSGDNVKLKDLLDEAERRALEVVLEKNPDFPESQRSRIAHSVGIGAVKYADLSKDRNSDYIFSWDKMLAFDGNTAPYMQYAHARIASIFRKAAGTGTIAPNIVPQLESPFEQALAKHLLRFQEVVGLVSRELKPHHLCAYLYDLAGKFSSFYENCEVLKSEEPTRSSRLLLIDITRRTLATGLELLGIEHPDQM